MKDVEFWYGDMSILAGLLLYYWDSLLSNVDFGAKHIK